MPQSILERIETGPPLLFDGGLGSRLIEMSLPAGKAPEAWVLQKPENIRRVHEEYVQAGADVIVACSFGANRIRLEKGSLQNKVADINRKAVDIAREAATEGTYVAADLGPSGEFFEPHGKLTESLAGEVFDEQAAVLAAAGVDFFLLETHYDLKEATICLEACRRVAPSIPVGALLTFNQTPRGFFTVMGDPAVDALKILAGMGAFLVGSNCTLEAGGMLDLAEAVVPQLETPLLFQANAGSPQITSDGVKYPQEPEEFCRYARKMLKLGIRAIGGCCGTNENHIGELRKLIDNEFK